MINGLILSWFLAGFSSSLVVACLIYKNYGDIEEIDLIPTISALILGWFSIVILSIFIIQQIILELMNNGFDKFRYYMIRRNETKEREKFEKWLLTPEGRQSKYKHLFKDA